MKYILPSFIPYISSTMFIVLLKCALRGVKNEAVVVYEFE